MDRASLISFQNALCVAFAIGVCRDGKAPEDIPKLNFNVTSAEAQVYFYQPTLNKIAEGFGQHDVDGETETIILTGTNVGLNLKLNNDRAYYRQIDRAFLSVNADITIQAKATFIMPSKTYSYKPKLNLGANGYASATTVQPSSFADDGKNITMDIITNYEFRAGTTPFIYVTCNTNNPGNYLFPAGSEFLHKIELKEV